MGLTTTVNITVPVHPHEHVPGGRAGFVAPGALGAISFTVSDLAAATAQASALSSAPLSLVQAICTGIEALLSVIVDCSSGRLLVTNDHNELADFGRTDLSAGLGAGIAHLYMLSLGYAFRCNGREIYKSGSVPDVLYSGWPTARGNFVAAEAKGQVRAKVTRSTLRSVVMLGFVDQVLPLLSGPRADRRLLHGYSIGTGVVPGDPNGASVFVVEADVGPSGGGRRQSAGQQANQGQVAVQPVMATANFRANLILAGVADAVNVIDSTTPGAPIKLNSERLFETISWQGREVFIAKQAHLSSGLFTGCRQPRSTFGLDAEIATAFLQGLARENVESIDLPLVSELALTAENRPSVGTRFPDGLVYFGNAGWETEPNREPKDLEPPAHHNPSFEEIQNYREEGGLTAGADGT